MSYRNYLLERYLIKAVVPYLLLSFFILTGILLLQQSGKFAEVLSLSRDPLSLTVALSLGVLPGIALFTLPMSALIGTATGLARLGSDSELIALRAAGISRLRLAFPILIFGALLSGFALVDGFIFAPRAAQSLRRTLYRATMDRLNSPIQPRTFNTQLSGKVIYVRDGDESHGEWGRIFIYWRDSDGELRLITARKGRLDVGGEQTELVLSDAVVMTAPAENIEPHSQIVTERSEQLRLKINSGRTALAAQLEHEPEEEELSWSDLIERARQGSTKEAYVAISSLHRRFALALTTFPFVLLGVGLGGRSRRGGRALGAVFSLFAMIGYYLVFLGGDYLIRVGAITPLTGNWAAAVLTLIFAIYLIFCDDLSLSIFPSSRQTRFKSVDYKARRNGFRRPRLSLLGLLDRSILTSLCLYFLLSMTILVGVFLTFTLFENLRIVAIKGTSVRLIPPYLLFLIPFASAAILPVATLLSILTTYALMARRSEAISWWSTGQSFYRLALPSLLFTLMICGLYYIAQEDLLPHTNRLQNQLHSSLRGGPVRAAAPVSGVQWLAVSDQQIYSYRYNEGQEDILGDVTLYQFDSAGTHLVSVISGKVGHVKSNGDVLLNQVSTIDKVGPENRLVRQYQALANISAPVQLFKPELKELNEYRIHDLRGRLRALSANAGTQGVPASLGNVLLVTLWQREIGPLYSLVMWLNALPLALSFGRRSIVRPLFIAVLLGLGFWLGNALLTQAGIYGLISPQLSVLLLPFILTLTGLYLLSNSRT